MTGASPPAEPVPDGDLPWALDDVEREYALLREVAADGRSGGAGVIDRSSRFRCTFPGPKAAEVLTGLVTNDVLALAPGQGCYAVALTPKGKILADVRLFARPGDVLVDGAARAAAGWWEMIRKYVNPRLSRYADVSTSTAELAVLGVRAHAVVAAALGVPWERLLHLPPYAHVGVEASDGDLLVARIPDFGVEGFSLIAPATARASLRAQLAAAGAIPIGRGAAEIARIEAGRPAWGVDMDDTTLAQEANMDTLHAISYTKGCYTGQETVARLHFRGHVNRYLRGLRYDEAREIPSRAEVRDGAGKPVGEVRSSVISPRLGGIALAMLRREVADDADVDVVWGDDGRATARVVALPFATGDTVPAPATSPA